MNTHLQCSFSESWNSIPIEPLQLKDLWCSVPVCNKNSFCDRVRESILTEGLKFPILVVPADRKDLLTIKKKYGERILELPAEERDLYYVVWGGSNRVNAIRQIGTYDSVDCAVFQKADFSRASSMQSLHRRPFSSLHRCLR